VGTAEEVAAILARVSHKGSERVGTYPALSSI
jgi:hypothetical protein